MPASRVLVTAGRGADASQSLNAEAEKRAKLDKLRSVVERLASRDSRGLTDEAAMTIENQHGEAVQLKAEDQKSLTMGLALHDMGKALMRKGDYSDALDRLLLAEEAFGLCDPTLTSAVDNVGMLLLDIVWCCYKLGDHRRLAVCRERLERCRAALTRAHGPRLERVRRLHGGAYAPEMATYVRLELLEGLVAYFGQDLPAAARCLEGARSKWQQLQVPDAQLALMQELGYGMTESRRALRFSGGDIDAALQFITTQRAQEEERAAKRRRFEAWRKERRRYGRTASGAYVDVEVVDRLTAMGYDKALAAEACLQADNAWDAALESLLDDTKRNSLLLSISLRKALKQAKADVKKQKQDEVAAAAAAAAAAVATGSAAGASEAGASGAGGGAADGDAATQAAIAAALAEDADKLAAQEAAAGGGQQEGKEEDEEEDEAGSGDQQHQPAQRSVSDDELEGEVLRQLQQDPMSAYDLDLREEGEVLAEYLALLASSSPAASASAAAPAPPGAR